MATATSFKTIRDWDGSQHRAFEEFCYQLRDPTPDSAELIKTGDPDAGVEWYIKFGNGVERGWQAKYSFSIDDLLKEMESSLKTVCEKRPRCRRLTFCIPFDLPDARTGKERKSAREKFEDRKKSWRKRIKGADRVTIGLWSAGDILERLARPEHRGIERFFWDKETFAPAWFSERLNVTTRTAGARYSPMLNIEIPVAFALEGLGRSEDFLRRYRLRRGDVVKASRRLLDRRFPGLGVNTELAALRVELRRCHAVLEVDAGEKDAFPASTMTKAIEAGLERAWAATPEGSHGRDKAGRDKTADLRSALGQLTGRLRDLIDFLASPAVQAAEQGYLVMTGEAGQGKTHLFCDAGQRALNSSRPCVVLLGQQFSGERVLTNLAEQLGLPDTGSTELLGAMRAAAEASGRPFVLLIDALNDSGNPGAWRHSLPALLSEVAQFAPWIVVGISIRSSYVDLIANEISTDVPRVEHPGFEGFEHEAAERYFDAFKLQQPSVPLLLPEFTNPLFLRLYCEALASGHVAPPERGHVHITDVFEGYLQAKNTTISANLQLDPQSRPVEKATAAFADAVANGDSEWLPREAARGIIDAHAPQLHQWPATLFGQLLSEGVLTADAMYRQTDNDEWHLVDGVRFTFQRFADYRIAGQLLPFQTQKDLEAALQPHQPLRKTILGARAGLVEALAVLLPERFGVELLDVARWRLDGMKAHGWHRATLASMATRRDDAVTERTRQLLSRASGRSEALFEQATETLIAVAARPEHLLNGDFLHGVLTRWPMPHRDASWGFVTYGGMNQRGSLDRLIRWAARGPYEGNSDDVIELASIPLVWTLSSPNRTMRDYVTKALTRLLSAHLPIVFNLLERFRRVDDPYVLQRLGVIAHGTVLVGGRDSPTVAVQIARLLVEIVRDRATLPDVLLRDAARGAMEWCWHEGLVEQGEWERARPPYVSDLPVRPRTQKQLEKQYERGSYNPPEPGYGSLFGSIFSMGDFGRYVIESDISHHFSNVPLNRPAPQRRKPRERKPDAKKMAEFETTLSRRQMTLVRKEDWDSFWKSLNEKQQAQLLQALYPPIRAPRSRAYPAELAQRWVFERVLELGWTPELFGNFERRGSYDMRVGRSGHKPERFGKKYQWIAVHELIARIADNFHMVSGWGEETIRYAGPWQYLGRDIDPTLPPAPRVRDDDGVENFGPTYERDSDTAWWIPPGPSYIGELPSPDAEWASQSDDIPETKSLVMRTDPQGKQWVVLQAYYNWDEQPLEDQERYEGIRRDMWSHIYSWIVAPKDVNSLIDYLGESTLMGRWMPEGHRVIDAAYVPEMPWAEAGNEYPSTWEAIEPRGGDEAPAIKVYPGWTEYSWEGNVWDCSIDEGVATNMPADELYVAGGLRLLRGTRQWSDAGGNVVAQYRESEGDRRSALLVRLDWLERTLKDRGWSLVLGRLGEKQLISGGFSPGLVGGWSEINGLAKYHEGRWTFDKDRLEIKHARK